MNKQLELKKSNRYQSKASSQSYYGDEISEMGRKGGKVIKERQQAHRIDLELRNFTYR